MEDETTELGGAEGLGPRQRHQAKHRELFLSRHVETLPATHIRGKCTVTLLNETESLLSYLNKDDAFFYCLVFDPTQKTLLADKGEIRVGTRYQTEMTNLLKEGEEDPRKLEDVETLVWTPEHGLTDRQIDQFLVVSRSVGTFARALDCSSSVKQPSLHMSAAAASRDITLFHAMDMLHRHEYRVEAAVSSLVPASGPVLCRDEMEEWSASEANLFEEALDKYGKDFGDIRQDFLPWKTLKNIVEYYYMWKTTDRYVQQKRVKAVEAESKLKQVYIPNYNKPNPALINNSKNSSVMNGGTNGAAVNAAPHTGTEICASCQVTTSSQWYAWGPSHMQCRLCASCWSYWKKYGGLKVAGGTCEGELEGGVATGPAGNGTGRKGATLGDAADEHSTGGHRPHRCTVINCAKEFKLRAHLARHYAQAHGAPHSPSGRPVMKTRAAFYLRATPNTRLARRLCRALRRPRAHARAPFTPINLHQVKHECSVEMANRTLSELRVLATARAAARSRGPLAAVALRLAGAQGVPPPARQEWLVLTPRDRMPVPAKVSFPKPPKAPELIAPCILPFTKLPSILRPRTKKFTGYKITRHHGSLLYERVPNKQDLEAASRPRAVASPALKRRYDDINGLDRGSAESGGTGTTTAAPPPAKRPNKHPQPMQRPSPEQYAAMCARAQATGQPLPPHIFAHVNGKPTSMTGRGGRRHVISWMDAPDDLYFRATEHAKVARRSLSSSEVRRAARAPWRAVGGAGKGTEPPGALQVITLD